jgi:hypothetical protein
MVEKLARPTANENKGQCMRSTSHAVARESSYKTALGERAHTAPGSAAWRRPRERAREFASVMDTPRRAETQLRDRAKALLARLPAFQPAQLLMLAALLALLPLLDWQVRSLAVPILGEHNWRQSDTYSVAYNFLHESSDFFHPRIDWAGNRSGIMGMEAPIYPYLTFLAMLVFGDSPAVARCVAWVLCVLGVLVFAQLLRPARRTSFSVGVLLMVFLAPMGLLELRQIQPDGPMCALMMMAAGCFHEFARSERRGYLAAGLGLYSLATLTKLPALAAGPAMWLLTFSVRPTPWRKVAWRAAAFTLPLAAALLWQLWARHLNDVYNAGQTYFAIDFNLATMLEDLSDREHLRHLFGSLLGAYVCNWTLLPALLVGFALGFEHAQRAVAFPMFAWLAGAGLFLAAFSSRLASHWYYALVIFPPVVYFGALALGRLIDLASARPPASPLSRWAGLVLVLTLAVARFVGGEQREMGGVPGGAGFPLDTTWVGELQLLTLLTLFAIGFGALQLRAPPHRPYFWLVVVAIAGALGLARASHDVIELFKWRSRDWEWETTQADWAELRRLLDVYSSRELDRIVEDGANPWYLYLPLRKGWNVAPKDIDEAGLDWYVARGVRFLVHYRHMRRKPRGLADRPLLGRAPKWELYCLIRDGCRPLAPRVRAQPSSAR